MLRFRNAVTGDKEYLPEFCDDYLPDLAECQVYLKEGGWIDNLDKIPRKYTGWPKEDSTLARLGEWTGIFMSEYTHTTANDEKPWYWYWDVLEQAWYAANLNHVVYQDVEN
jgi:hypothetical protein